jgi:sarcosine oxidase subunit gamma
MCTRTIFGKAEIILWRIDEHHFWIETGRSFATYVWSLLAEARLELE